MRLFCAGRERVDFVAKAKKHQKALALLRSKDQKASKRVGISQGIPSRAERTQIGLASQFSTHQGSFGPTKQDGADAAQVGEPPPGQTADGPRSWTARNRRI